jgi:hypothetical protein
MHVTNAYDTLHDWSLNRVMLGDEMVHAASGDLGRTKNSKSMII